MKWFHKSIFLFIVCMRVNVTWKDKGFRALFYFALLLCECFCFVLFCFALLFYIIMYFIRRLSFFDLKGKIFLLFSFNNIDFLFNLLKLEY